jgi:hypothetical protein
MKIMNDHFSQAKLTCPTQYFDKMIEKLAECTDEYIVEYADKYTYL